MYRLDIIRIFGVHDRKKQKKKREFARSLLMDYYSAYCDQLQNGGSRGGGIPRVFVGSPYQRGHGIGSFLGGLFRRILPYLSRGARAVGKEALRAGVNIIDDVDNNTPLKVAAKHRFEESRNNLKRQAKEKIKSLMKGSGYKSDAKIHVAQFPFGGLNTHFAKSTKTERKRRRSSKKSLSKIKARGKKRTNTKSSKDKRKKSRATVKRLKTTAKRRKIGKKRTVSDIFS